MGPASARNSRGLLSRPSSRNSSELASPTCPTTSSASSATSPWTVSPQRHSCGSPPGTGGGCHSPGALIQASWGAVTAPRPSRVASLSHYPGKKSMAFPSSFQTEREAWGTGWGWGGAKHCSGQQVLVVAGSGGRDSWTLPGGCSAPQTARRTVSPPLVTFNTACQGSLDAHPDPAQTPGPLPTSSFPWPTVCTRLTSGLFLVVSDSLSCLWPDNGLGFGWTLLPAYPKPSS